MMARMARRGQRILLRLTMGAQTLPDVDSFNTVAEITGSEHPEQVGDFKYAVLISQKTPDDNTLANFTNILQLAVDSCVSTRVLYCTYNTACFPSRQIVTESQREITF